METLHGKLTDNGYSNGFLTQDTPASQFRTSHRTNPEVLYTRVITRPANQLSPTFLLSYQPKLFSDQPLVCCYHYSTRYLRAHTAHLARGEGSGGHCSKSVRCCGVSSGFPVLSPLTDVRIDRRRKTILTYDVEDQSIPKLAPATEEDSVLIEVLC